MSETAPGPAPVFTPEQVRNLDRHQHWTHVHPFTCPNRHDGHHFDNGRDVGCLVPTIRGWICQCCDYTQGWAHQMMLDGTTPPPWDFGKAARGETE